MKYHSDEPDWRKASASNGSGGSNCVEVAQVGEEIHVRDSKHPDLAPLSFTKAEWDAFVAGVEAGEFRF